MGEPLAPEEIVAIHVGSRRAPFMMRDFVDNGYTVCGPSCGCSCLAAFHDHDAAASQADSLDVERERLVAAALRFYADQMPAYAAAAGLTQEEYAAVMVDVRRAREYAAPPSESA